MAKLKKRPDGRYQRKVTLSDGKQKIVYGRTLAELNAAADALRDADRGGLNVGDGTTVAQWAELWLQTYKAELRANTRRMYADILRLHVLPILGQRKLQDVRPVHAQAVLSSVADKSESLQRKALITMRQLFVEARRNRLIAADPTDGLKITPHTAPPKKQYLTRDEADALMQAVTDPRARAFCGLCLYCGLRREEALGVQWFDIRAGKLTVRRAVTFVDGRRVEDMQLKTKAAHRILPIPAPLQAILDETPRRSPYVVTAAGGGDMSLMAFRRMWEKVPGAADGLHPHMLRHTYATTLYHAGVDMRTAQKLLGHSSITMTANIYTHLEAEDSLAAIGRLNEYYASREENASKSILAI